MELLSIIKNIDKNQLRDPEVLWTIIVMLVVIFDFKYEKMWLVFEQNSHTIKKRHFWWH